MAPSTIPVSVLHPGTTPVPYHTCPAPASHTAHAETPLRRHLGSAVSLLVHAATVHLSESCLDHHEHGPGLMAELIFYQGGAHKEVSSGLNTRALRA